MLKSVISVILTTTTGVQNKKGHKTNNKRKERRKKLAKTRIETQREKHEKFIKNFSNQQLSDSLLALISKGLKFVPTPVTDANYIRRQLLLDFEHFARRMRLKDTMDFVNFIGKTKVCQDTILVSMDATSLYTNIPQEEGITTVCKAYEAFHSNKPAIPSHQERLDPLLVTLPQTNT